jgi:hypothetical protein
MPRDRNFEEAVELLYSLYESDFYKGKSASRSFKDAFVDFIQKSHKSFERVFIIIDGLDEVTNPQPLLMALLELQASDNKINILAISRPEKDIEDAFCGMASMTIKETSIKHDISKYVELEFSVGQLSLIKPELKMEIKETLLAKGGGM